MGILGMSQTLFTLWNFGVVATILLTLPFVMSLYHSQRRQKIVSYTFIVVLVALILAVRALPQPWRGIIDGGVVVGLGLGALSVVHFWVRGLRGDPPPAPDLPENTATATG